MQIVMQSTRAGSFCVSGSSPMRIDFSVHLGTEQASALFEVITIEHMLIASPTSQLVTVLPQLLPIEVKIIIIAMREFI